MPINAVNSAAVPTSPKGKLEYFANLKDDELLYLAQNQAFYDGKTRKQNNSTRSLIKTVPVVDSMMAVSEKSKAAGIVGLGALSTSLSAFAGRLSSWVLLFGGLDVVDKLYDKAVKKSDTLAEIDEKHPMTKLLTELGVVVTASVLGKKYKNNLLNLIPKSIKTGGIKKFNSLKTMIDSSKIAKNIYEPMIKKLSIGASKYPKLVANIKSLKPLILPAMILGAIIKASIIDPLKYNQKVANNFIALKGQQEILKTALGTEDKEIAVDDDIEDIAQAEINMPEDISGEEIDSNDIPEITSPDEINNDIAQDPEVVDVPENIQNEENQQFDEDNNESV